MSSSPHYRSARGRCIQIEARATSFHSLAATCRRRRDVVEIEPTRVLIAGVRAVSDHLNPHRRAGESVCAPLFPPRGARPAKLVNGADRLELTKIS